MHSVRQHLKQSNLEMLLFSVNDFSLCVYVCSCAWFCVLAFVCNRFLGNIFSTYPPQVIRQLMGICIEQRNIDILCFVYMTFFVLLLFVDLCSSHNAFPLQRCIRTCVWLGPCRDAIKMGLPPFAPPRSLPLPSHWPRPLGAAQVSKEL